MEQSNSTHSTGLQDPPGNLKTEPSQTEVQLHQVMIFPIDYASPVALIKGLTLMKNFMMKLGCVFAVSVAMASAASAQAVKPQEVIGQSWNFKQGKITGKITYRSSTVKAQFGGKTYNGQLRIKGNQICTKYKELRKGKESCFSLTKTKNGYKTSKGGELWK